MPLSACRGQGTTCRSQLSPSTIGMLKIPLRAWQQVPFTRCASPKVFFLRSSFVESKLPTSLLWISLESRYSLESFGFCYLCSPLPCGAVPSIYKVCMKQLAWPTPSPAQCMQAFCHIPLSLKLNLGGPRLKNSRDFALDKAAPRPSGFIGRWHSRNIHQPWTKSLKGSFLTWDGK